MLALQITFDLICFLMSKGIWWLFLASSENSHFIISSSEEKEVVPRSSQTVATLSVFNFPICPFPYTLQFNIVELFQGLFE